MQLPPLDLSAPDAAQSDSIRDVPDIAWLVIVTLIVTVAAFLALTMIHEDHAYHADRAPTAEFAACLSRAMTPEAVDACKPVMPWYAAHPIWYALAIGAAVFGVGRLYLFMRRMEASRGY